MASGELSSRFGRHLLILLSLSGHVEPFCRILRPILCALLLMGFALKLFDPVFTVPEPILTVPSDGFIQATALFL